MAWFYSGGTFPQAMDFSLSWISWPGAALLIGLGIYMLRRAVK